MIVFNRAKLECFVEEYATMMSVILEGKWYV